MRHIMMQIIPTPTPAHSRDRHRHRADDTRLDAPPQAGESGRATYARRLSSRDRRHVRFAALSTLFLLVLAAGSVVGETEQARADETARIEHTEAREFLRARADLAGTVIAEATLHVDAVRMRLDSPDGELLSADERATVEETLTAADTLLRDSRHHVAEATRVSSIPPPPDATVQDVLSATTALEETEFVSAAEINALHRALTREVALVDAAVEAWQAEQQRLAAERAAQELAAKQAAEAQARAAADQHAAAEARAAAEAQAENVRQQAESPGNAGAPAPGAAVANPPATKAPVAQAPRAQALAPAPAAPAPVHTEHVWATGFQKEIDACKGSVDMTPTFGKPVIGEHWSCGGRDFPMAAGSIVTVTGVLSGTFRVGPVVAVLNQRTNTTNDVPGGYDLLYQTCVGGDNTRMSFTALERIG
jgi:hypothetical protein